jgi:hypothetical protein
MMAPWDAFQRPTSFPGASTDSKEMLGLTCVRNGAVVRFFKRFSAINAGFVVWPASGQPSKLPSVCPEHIGTDNATKKNKPIILTAVALRMFSTP